MTDGRPANAPATLRQRLGALRRRLLRGADPRAVALDTLEGLDLDDGLPGIGGFVAEVGSDARRLAPALRRLVQEPAVAEALGFPTVTRRLAGAEAVRHVSMGSLCFTSAFLRRWGLRHQAGPFDWLFSTQSMIKHIIDDDFRLFLDRSQYRPVPLEQRVAGPGVNRVDHEFYLREFGVKHVFNHHDVHLDPDHAHFVRAVDRFRAWMASDERKLMLVTCGLSQHYVPEAPLLHESLARSGRRLRLVVVGIANPQPQLRLPRVEPIGEGAGWTVMRFEPVSQWGPLAFPALIDELNLLEIVSREAEAIA